MDILKSTFEKPTQSYWIASTHKTDYPSLDNDIKVDAAIIGGGITGITCAYLLSKEGLKVAVIEADRIAQGTTGHTTAKITSQHDLIYDKIKNQMGVEPAKQYADANEYAIRFIREIAEDLNVECDYTEQSAYIFTQQEEYVQKLEDETRTASGLGIKAEYLDEIPLDIPVKAAMRFDNQAQFHPRKYLIAMAKQAEHMGAKIFENTRAVDIEENDGYTVTTKSGNKVSATRLIIASHYPFYNKAGGYFTRIYPDRSYVIAVKAKEKYPGGMYINAENPARSFRNLLTDDGELILVGGEHHKTGQGIDTVKHYEALIDYAKNLYTIEDIPFRWSTQDCMTLDDVPYIGHFTSKTPNMYIATGYKKWGMTNSAVSGMLLRDLIVKGKSPWMDVYNPSRQSIIASTKNFVVENINVGVELVKGKLSPIPEDIELKTGEGKEFLANGQRAGAYKDEHGAVHVVNTTCTHMGCELNWNSAEKTWDCPCHGSRFTYEGKVAEGPAHEPLEMNKNTNTVEKLVKDKY